MQTKSYDIFISYRREGGEDKARILNQHLSAVGYNVFFDHEAAISGEFETVILAAVEVSPVFIILLTPGCFDRCINEDDWIRREIEKAHELKKEIIPVIPNGYFSFTNLSSELPLSILKLQKIQFADIDYHKHFKSTANEMIEERIKPTVKPSVVTIDGGNIGAKIHFFSDISCRILSYGNQIAVTNAEDKIYGVVARLLKGRHRLEFKSIEHDADAYSEVLNIPENDYEDYFNISLNAIKNKRIEKEKLQKEEENRKAEIERQRIEKERASNSQSQDKKLKFDVFISYSRQDATIVRYIASILEKSGYKCFIDVEGIQSGASIENTRINAIDTSKCMLFFHSESNNNSYWAENELRYAINKNKYVIPVKLDECPYSSSLMFYLSTLESIQFKNKEVVYDILKKLESLNIVSNQKTILTLVRKIFNH